MLIINAAHSALLGSTPVKQRQGLSHQNRQYASTHCDTSYKFDASRNSALWSACEVQSRLNCLVSQIDEDNIRSFPLLYKTMTAKRDDSRLSGHFTNGVVTSERVNDYLADIMTRYLVICYQDSLDKSYIDKECGYSLSSSIASARESGRSNLGTAMQVTADYIGPHLSMSLSALILDDVFWESIDPDEFGSEVKCHLDNRISAVNGYKDVFDMFNIFLRKNISDVALSLCQAGLSRENLVSLSRLASRLPILEYAFGHIRDRAFHVSIDLAEEYAESNDHPMVGIIEGKRQVEFHGVSDFSKHQKVRDLETFCHDAVAGVMAEIFYQPLSYN